ncbi:MAG: hypothetical protein J6J01_07105 [Oscillospiraceae bacterium]|nr:hypothetical protein [Oscillospiraceae bacterium]
MKKLLILASILLVLALVFVACTDKDPGEETSGESVTVEDSVTDAPTEESTEEPTEEPDVTEEPTEAPTEEPTKEPDVTEAPTEAPPETPTEPPVEDPDAPVYAVGSVVLADYASQTGDAWYMMHLEVPEVMSEGTRTFARMIPNGPDPYFVITESIVDRQIGRYMAISYRTNITTFGTMFLGYGACWNGVNDIVYVDWNEDENWNLVIIDLLQTDITAFTGDIINYGRFSIYEHYNGYEAQPEDYFDIEYVAFFNSDEAAEKYDAEMHKVPMWDEDLSIVVHQSFDQLYTGTGDAGNGPENIFEPGKSADWDLIADLSAITADTLTYWGWIGYYGELGQFGYQINGGSAVYNSDFAFVGADHAGIIDTAQNTGADSGHRMKIAISLAGLDGENTVRVLYKDADGYEVCLNEFTVKLVAHEHSHEAVVTAPTCTEAGYTTYTCACGDSYVADEVAALGHSYVDGACSVCGAIDPDSIDPDAIVPAYLAQPEQLSAWASMTGDAWHCWDIVSSTMTVEDGRSFARIRVSNWDPYFVINETHNETHIGRYMAISYRTNIPATGRLLMGVGECWNNVDDLIDVDWNEDGNWHLMIIDVHTALPALANNLITYGRFSIYENSDAYLGQATDYFDIEYIAFFDTEEDAQKYDAELDRTHTHEHSHEAVVTAPTCTEAGYTTYTCSCGNSYVVDEVAALGHTYVDGACSVCGGLDPDSIDPDTIVPTYLATAEQLSAWASMTGDAWHSMDIVSSTVTEEDGRTFASMRVHNADPYFVINETHNETQIGRYMAISYRTNIAAKGRLLIGMGACWNNVDDVIILDWNEDENWHLMIVDMHAALPALSNNLITYGRLSIYDNSNLYLGQETDYFDIEYVMFFDAEEDAQSYDAVLD